MKKKSYVLYTNYFVYELLKKPKHVPEEKARLVHIEDILGFVFLDKIWNPFHPRLHKAIVNIPPLTILYQLCILQLMTNKTIQLILRTLTRVLVKKPSFIVRKGY